VDRKLLICFNTSAASTVLESEAAGSEGAGSEAVGSEAVGSEAVGSEAAGSEAVGSEAAGSEANGSEAVGSEANGSEAIGSEAAGSEAAGSEAAGSEANGNLDLTAASCPPEPGSEAAGTRLSEWTSEEPVPSPETSEGPADPQRAVSLDAAECSDGGGDAALVRTDALEDLTSIGDRGLRDGPGESGEGAESTSRSPEAQSLPHSDPQPEGLLTSPTPPDAAPHGGSEPPDGARAAELQRTPTLSLPVARKSLVPVALPKGLSTGSESSSVNSSHFFFLLLRSFYRTPCSPPTPSLPRSVTLTSDLEEKRVVLTLCFLAPLCSPRWLQQKHPRYY